VRARLYRRASNDAAALDKLLGHNRAGDVRLDLDRVIVVDGHDSVPTGTLVWRPAGFIHEFHCGGGLARRQIATALTNYAWADAVAQLHRISQAVFLVDRFNAPMLRYLREEIKATEQSQDSVVFLVDL
jgi:hypothetical protein